MADVNAQGFAADSFRTGRKESWLQELVGCAAMESDRTGRDRFLPDAKKQ